MYQALEWFFGLFEYKRDSKFAKCVWGLMTANGHTVAKPLYKGINAIGHDLYLRAYTNNVKVIVNSKGEIVK